MKEKVIVKAPIEKFVHTYIFSNEQGSTITVNIEAGSCTSASLVNESENSSKDISIQKSSKADFERALIMCKSNLESIGLFKSFKKDLDDSLDYKYKGITATQSQNNNDLHATGVFSSKLYAVEGVDNNGHKFYSLQNKTNQYAGEFDENGEIVLADEYDQPSIDITDQFKWACLSGVSIGNTNKISQDEETGKYTIISETRNSNQTVEIIFNEDLSIELKIKDSASGIVVDYKIEKITKAQFNETYNKVLNIVESVKENQSGATVE